MERATRLLTLLASIAAVTSCGGPAPTATATTTAQPTSTATAASTAAPTPTPSPIVHVGFAPVETGDPIRLADLSGRIVFDDFEDVFAMDVDGSHVTTVAGAPGAEFDGAWSPDGKRVVYRDSTRGINEDDEIFVVAGAGSARRNITNDPANDWGPDWSADGKTIAFNSDRDGGSIRGFLVDPDGAHLRALDIEGWVEYPSFSPDGTRIAYMGHNGGDYEIYTADIATGTSRQLTDAPGQDGWPVWSPDGSLIAFSSERDDCTYVAATADCWRTGEQDAHRDVWVMNADGSGQRRVTPENGQFVAWSPDSRFLLVSGRALYVVRLDGTGRLELRAHGIDRPLGGIPDWH